MEDSRRPPVWLTCGDPCSPGAKWSAFDSLLSFHPTGTFPMKWTLILAALLIPISFAFADNVPDKVRLVPPEGNKIPDAEY